ncbi:MAG: GTP cyclohydrolase FolE2 [Planctomycetota bacterium]|nr:GTP cyclohydrolase I FolE2 [Planctomycetaceae bacterium]MDQ3330658.1 GTP cyclohydrolase FolE2 [Planctomycetota bacterium]
MSELLSDVLNLAQAQSAFDAPRVLPDVTADSVAAVRRTLDRVGMSGIELVLRRTDSDGVAVRVPARAEAAVSLDDAEAKGIHMSRLFLRLQEEFDRRDFGPAAVEDVLAGFIKSHHEISRSAFLAVDFEHLVRRPSLLSDLSGWRSYPVRIEATGDAVETTHVLRVRLTYSSTCPCSAALSRQLVQERFSQAFGERTTVPVGDVAAWLGTQQAIAALPHSQRSHADVAVRLNRIGDEYPVDRIIEVCEAALGTAVQTAVKRVDEQEFARRNAEQLMFCEDAARLLAEALDDVGDVDDYHVRVRHLESLHPHDAVAVVTKGVEAGFRA